MGNHEGGASSTRSPSPRCPTSRSRSTWRRTSGSLNRPPPVQPAGPLLPGHRFLHPRAPHRQAPAACHHQEPPQVLLNGQWHERRHDARALLLAGQWGWGWRQQGQQPQAVQVHPAAAEPPPELLAQQLQDLLATGGSAWECSWRALGPVLCAGDFGHIAPPGRHGGRIW